MQLCSFMRLEAILNSQEHKILCLTTIAWFLKVSFFYTPVRRNYCKNLLTNWTEIFVVHLPGEKECFGICIFESVHHHLHTASPKRQSCFFHNVVWCLARSDCCIWDTCMKEIFQLMLCIYVPVLYLNSNVQRWVLKADNGINKWTWCLSELWVEEWRKFYAFNSFVSILFVWMHYRTMVYRSCLSY
jgi:hypothetical protein